MVSRAYVHVVEVGTPVTPGGLTARPGDLLLGDQHGVAAIPLAIARQLPDGARRVEERERAIIALCQLPDFDLEQLDELYGQASGARR